MITRNSNIAKDLWKTIHDITGANKSDKSIKDIKYNGKLLTNEEGNADDFNVYFTNIEEELGSKISKPNTPTPRRVPFVKSFFLEPATGREIVNIINARKPNKSPDMDGIRAEIK